MIYNEDNISFIRDTKLYSVSEGFNKGNMFKNLYSKYKNYSYTLKVTNDKDKLLYNIQMNNFALKDLILYLDVHPNDTNMIKEYMNIKNNLNNYKKQYESKYGPLYADDVMSNTNWTWIKNPWPWDTGR